MMARLAIFLFIIPFIGVSQNTLLPSLINTVPNADASIIHHKMNSFISTQKGKMGLAKNDIKFLKTLVRDSHKNFLKTYKSYSQFNEVFENGSYDCLTGTSFFSVLLDELNFDYKIIETNYHIFLLIETRQGRVLLETTDRLFGFKTNTGEIDKCLNEYKENRFVNEGSTKIRYYQYQSNLFREVKSLQIPGLLYFNQAVVAFNNHDWTTCAKRLEQARMIYANPRVDELSKILANAISVSQLDEKLRRDLIYQLLKNISTSQVVAIR
jgi:hypothetical protein